MNFHANYVSTSVFGDGDYYQATFEAEQDTDDPDSPYLLIQRQFEDPDDNWCYIETHVPASDRAVVASSGTKKSISRSVEMWGSAYS